MLTSIFLDNFIGVQLILIAEYIIWMVVLYRSRKLSKPININSKYSKFAPILFFATMSAGILVLLHYHDYYHDQSFVENGKIPPFKIYTELLSCLFAFITTKIDWDKDKLRFQKKHKIILTEDDDNDE